MKKQHLLAAAVLCTAASCLATPVSAMSENDNDPVQLTHRETVSAGLPAASGKQAAESSMVSTGTAGMSDEVWLLCSALLGLTGIFIAYKTAH